jgi:hypothetical protein
MGNKTLSNKALTFLAAVIVLVVAVTSISAVVAYMIKRSDDVKNTFVPAKIDYNVVEDFDGEIKTSVKVQSTSNTDTYVRVRVVTYWKDSKGNVVARTSPEVGFGANNGGTWKYNAEDWLYDAANSTFYLKTTLAPHATTDDILSLAGAFTGIKLESETVTESGTVEFTYHPVVTFIVEGIQANPQKAVTESWGVTLDSNGNITTP